MATEHFVDLSTGMAMDQDTEPPRPARLTPGQRIRAERQQSALFRLRQAAHADPRFADLLVVLGLER